MSASPPPPRIPVEHYRQAHYRCIACEAPKPQFACAKCHIVRYCSEAEAESDSSVHRLSGECARVRAGVFDDGADTEQFRTDYASTPVVPSIVQATSTLMNHNEHDVDLLVAALAVFAKTHERQQEFVSFVANYLSAARLFELLFVSIDNANNTPYSRRMSTAQVHMLVAGGAPAYRDYRVSRYPEHYYSQPAQPMDSEYYEHTPAVGTALGGGSALLLAVVRGRYDIVAVLLANANNVSPTHVHRDLHTVDVHIDALLDNFTRVRAPTTVSDLMQRDTEGLLPLHYAARGNSMRAYDWLQSLTGSADNTIVALNEALKYRSVEVAAYIVTRHAAKLHLRMFDVLTAHSYALSPRVLDAMLVSSVVRTRTQCIQLAAELANRLNCRGLRTLLMYTETIEPTVLAISPIELLHASEVCTALAYTALHSIEWTMGAVKMLSTLYPNARLVETLVLHAAQYDIVALVKRLMTTLQHKNAATFAEQATRILETAVAHASVECVRLLLVQYNPVLSRGRVADIMSQWEPHVAATRAASDTRALLLA